MNAMSADIIRSAYGFFSPTNSNDASSALICDICGYKTNDIILRHSEGQPNHVKRLLRRTNFCDGRMGRDGKGLRTDIVGRCEGHVQSAAHIDVVKRSGRGDGGAGGWEGRHAEAIVGACFVLNRTGHL